MKLFDNNTSEIKVKICGIANQIDIQECTKAGVSALGFLLGEANGEQPTDKLSISEAKELVKKVPTSVASVLLLKDDDFDELEVKISYIKPTAIQLQSQSLKEETVAKLNNSFPNLEIIKTIKIQDLYILEDIIQISQPFLIHINAVLFDSPKGGSGKIHNWSLSNKAFEYFKTKNIATILAGGLNTTNILSAIDIAKPNLVDIMSGVSFARGVKNIPEVINLMKLIKQLNVS